MHLSSRPNPGLGDTGRAVPTAWYKLIIPLIDSDTPREAQPGGWEEFECSVLQ